MKTVKTNKIQFKWRHPKPGLFHYLQTWWDNGSRVVAIVDRGTGGRWYATTQLLEPLYGTRVEHFRNSALAKKHIEDGSYPKMPTIDLEMPTGDLRSQQCPLKCN